MSVCVWILYLVCVKCQVRVCVDIVPGVVM